MNQEKELLKQVKDKVAREKGFPRWDELYIIHSKYPTTLVGFQELTEEVTFRYANELLKLRLGEVREEIDKLQNRSDFPHCPFTLISARKVIDKTLKNSTNENT